MFKWTNQRSADDCCCDTPTCTGSRGLVRSASVASSSGSDRRASSGSSCSESRRQPPLPPRRSPSTRLSSCSCTSSCVPGHQRTCSSPPLMNVPLPLTPPNAAISPHGHHLSNHGHPGHPHAMPGHGHALSGHGLPHGPPQTSGPISPGAQGVVGAGYSHCTCCCQHRTQYMAYPTSPRSSSGSENIYESLSPYLKQHEHRIYESPPSSAAALQARSCSVRVTSHQREMTSQRQAAFFSPQPQRRRNDSLPEQPVYNTSSEGYGSAQSSPRSSKSSYSTGVYCEIPVVPDMTKHNVLLRHHSDLRHNRPDSVFDRLPLPPPELLHIETSGGIVRNTPSPVMPLPPPPAPQRHDSDPYRTQRTAEDPYRSPRTSDDPYRTGRTVEDPYRAHRASPQRTAVVPPFREQTAPSIPAPPPAAPPPPFALGVPPAPPPLPAGGFPPVGGYLAGSPTDTLSSLGTSSTGYSTYSSCSSRGAYSPTGGRHVRKPSLDSTGSSGYQSVGGSPAQSKPSQGSVCPADIVAQLSNLKSASRKPSVTTGTAVGVGSQLQEELNKVKLKKTNRPVKEPSPTCTVNAGKSKELELIQSRIKQQLQSKEIATQQEVKPPPTLAKASHPVPEVKQTVRDTPPAVCKQTREATPPAVSPAQSSCSSLSSITSKTVRANSLSPREEKASIDPQLAQIQARIQRRLTQAENTPTDTQTGEQTDAQTADIPPPPPPDDDSFPEPPPMHMLVIGDENSASSGQSNHVTAASSDSRVSQTDDFEKSVEQAADLTPIPTNCPDWKRVLIEKKNQEKLAEARGRLEVERAEVEKWKGIPDWKKKIILEKQKKNGINTPS